MMLSHSLIRFAIVGGLATLVHVTVFVVLVEMQWLTPFYASIPAFVTALLISYLGNHRWTFEAEANHGYHFPRFVVVALLGLVLNLLIVTVVVEWLMLWYGIALGLIVTVIPLVSFLLSRYWAFAR